MNSESEQRLSLEELKQQNRSQGVQMMTTPSAAPTKQDWEDLLTAGAFAAAELPVEQFPDQNSALTAVQAVHLRPAGGEQVYVDLLYRPYESIYPTEDGLRVHWQRMISREMAAGYLSATEKS